MEVKWAKLNSFINKFKLTAREMDSTRAICDTLLPSINSNVIDVINPPAASSGGGGGGDGDSAADVKNNIESINTFYQTSASMLGTQQVVGEYMSGRLRHPLQGLLRLVLWLLSTWYGTFIICGTRGLSSQFPYFRKFSDIEPQRREEIMLSWSLSSFYLFRLLFRALKLIVLFFCFTQVNERNENPTWKALGYCGPDPKHTNRLSNNNNNNEDQSSSSIEEDPSISGPLQGALLHMNTTNSTVANTLSSAFSQVGIPLTVQPQKKKKPPLLTIHCDAVIVGSGSGGSVVAGVLAKAGYKVLVLEKGGYHARQNLTLLEGHAMHSMYEGAGLLATSDTGIVLLAGSTVGGGSTINWSAALRTPDHVRSEWCNCHGLKLFGSDTYSRALDVVCEKMEVGNRIDGEENLNNSVLRRGCSALGYPVSNIARNSPPDHYCGWCCFGCRDGSKKGTCETWLLDLLDSRNGLVLPGCTATRVLSERRHKNSGCKRNLANGVVFEYENACTGVKETCVVKSKVTVVAGGALGTPVLLKKSGLRNASIGRNLHLHPVVMAWGYFPQEKNLLSYEGGIMTAMSTVLSDSSGYGAVIQTPQLHPGMFAAIMPWVSGTDFKERMTRFAHTAHMFTLARDKGKGSVDSEGMISYRLDKSDEEVLKRGVEKMLRIMRAAGAVEMGTHHCTGERLKTDQAAKSSDEEIMKASKRGLRNLSTTLCSAHQMGSCRMGVSEKTSAVDEKGEAWEVDGLYVADSSVFPTALGVNPMVTVQAIAYCTAHSILDKLQKKNTNTCC